MKKMNKLITSYLNIFALLAIQFSYARLAFAGVVIPPSCPNGVTTSDLNRVVQIMAGESESTVQKQVDLVCNDMSLTDPQKMASFKAFITDPYVFPPPPLPTVINQSVPDSLRRRLMLNSGSTAYSDPNVLNNIITTNTLPDGVSPYFPEEKEAMELIGLDTSKFPPGNDNGDVQKYANEMYQGAVDSGGDISVGVLNGFIVSIISALMSPSMFVGCPALVSSQIYFWASMAFLGEALSIIVRGAMFKKNIMSIVNKDPANKINSVLDEFIALSSSVVTDEVAEETPELVDEGGDVFAFCNSAVSSGSFPDTVTCLNMVNTLSVDANTLMDKGADWLKCRYDILIGGANDQVNFLKIFINNLKQTKKLIIELAVATSIVGAAWTTALGFAIYEATATGGIGGTLGAACSSGLSSTQNQREKFVFSGQHFNDLENYKKALEGAKDTFSIINIFQNYKRYNEGYLQSTDINNLETTKKINQDNFLSDSKLRFVKKLFLGMLDEINFGNNFGISNAFAEGDKDFAADAKKSVQDKQYILGVIGWILGGAGFAASLFQYIPSARGISGARIFIIGVAALNADLGTVYLWKVSSYIKKLLHDMEIITAGLEKTLKNERVDLDGGDWTKTKSHIKEIKKGYEDAVIEAGKTLGEDEDVCDAYAKRNE